MKLQKKRLALAGGIVWGGMMFIVTLASMSFGYGNAFLDVMASIYPGYSISVGGSIVGFIYGFLDVYVGVYVFGWVYRRVGK